MRQLYLQNFFRVMHIVTSFTPLNKYCYYYSTHHISALSYRSYCLLDLNEITKYEWTQKLSAKNSAREEAVAQPAQPEEVDIEDDTAVARRQREFVKVDTSAIYIRMEGNTSRVCRLYIIYNVDRSEFI